MRGSPGRGLDELAGGYSDGAHGRLTLDRRAPGAASFGSLQGVTGRRGPGSGSMNQKLVPKWLRIGPTYLS